jgi:hypothetical protein
MDKALLMSIMIATVVLPIRAARDPEPLRALRRVLLWLVGFNVFYLVGIIWVLPRIR